MEFYDQLKERLNTHHTWPGSYLFKFVVPEMKREELLGLIPTGLRQERWSKNGRYVALSIKTHMPDADAVIAVYQRVTVVEGLVSL